jgi:hypothetical protein
MAGGWGADMWVSRSCAPDPHPVHLGFRTAAGNLPQTVFHGAAGHFHLTIDRFHVLSGDRPLFENRKRLRFKDIRRDHQVGLRITTPGGGIRGLYPGEGGASSSRPTSVRLRNRCNGGAHMVDFFARVSGGRSQGPRTRGSQRLWKIVHRDSTFPVQGDKYLGAGGLPVQ